MMTENEESDGAPLRENESFESQDELDMSADLPPDKDSNLDEDRTVYNFILSTLKLITYSVVFIIVLGASVISKLTTFLMTSQLRSKTEGIAYCNRTYRVSSAQFESSSSPEERISWMWAIYFCFMLPEALSFLIGLRKMIFKGSVKPTLIEFTIPLVFETLHTIGLTLFVYLVLPTMDAGKGIMLTNAMCIVPGVLGMLSRNYQNKIWVYLIAIDILAVIFQIAGLIVWPLTGKDTAWVIPLSAVLISFGWWENFVEVTSPFRIVQKLGEMKTRLRKSRSFTYTMLSLWKMGVFLAMMVVVTKVTEGKWSTAFDVFAKAFKSHDVIITTKRFPVRLTSPLEESYLKKDSFNVASVKTAVLYTMGVQMISTCFCYIFGNLACRILIQRFSYSIPLLLNVPVALITLVGLCGSRADNVCFWESVFPGYLWWTCPQDSFWNNFWEEHSWAWLLWLVSQTWITIHIWSPKCPRLAPTQIIFATPMYNAFLVDQSLTLNRRRDEADQEIKVEQKCINNSEIDTERRVSDSRANSSVVRDEDWIPKIIACATMWHETKSEMKEMLKSILRLDDDYSARWVATKVFGIKDPNNYKFETNIFFDDAFQKKKRKNRNKPKPKVPNMVLNSFVKDFIDQLEAAASEVNQVARKLHAPKKIPTPYGGRLEWILPGGTKLVCHLKDSNKIRHKKRWSQVMYMYYFLSHKLMKRNDLPKERKEVIAANTFLLALDGDIVFQPKAVESLVDLMKKNPNLGAACGRIHPIGNGPMVWYQKFEYAVGHWFQKATEHVFGCVLCSPGCFSLFRGQALIKYVAKTYTKMATEPRHYVQYDQGEDRWLCTLLLQCGWRVEYSAASDAYTHAPETFREFFNQRRRWIPSTMANILDLLQSGSKTVKQNPDISYPYIMYQMFLMIGSILGPGTIFLMMVGSFAVAFKLDQWTSFLYNFIPIFLFILACIFLKSDVQLAIAEILTTIYALAMVAVVVAIILQVVDDGLFAPTTLFLIIVAGSFIIAGIVHPLEFWCLPHGFLYYISIPSMYLLLIIYSLFNLNDVSWGTRVGPEDDDDDMPEQQHEAKAEQDKNKKRKSLLGGIIPGFRMGRKQENDEKGSFEISCASLFKLACCINEKPNKQKSDTVALLSESRLDNIDNFYENASGKQSASVSRGESKRNSDIQICFGDGFSEIPLKDNKVEIERTREKKQRNDLITPYWMEGKELSKFQADFLTRSEVKFWKKIISKYLFRLEKNEQKEQAMAKSLRELRNKVAFTFVMCNAVFVVLIFLLQLDKEAVHIKWPFAAKTNVTYIATAGQVEVSFDYLELEPIGLSFIAVFGLVLGIQFIGMMIHRLSTFLYIMAATEINFFSKDANIKMSEDEETKEEIGIIRRLQSRRAEKEKGNLRNRKITVVDFGMAGSRLERPPDLARNACINFEELFQDENARQRSEIFQSDKRREAFERLGERRDTVRQRQEEVAIQQGRRLQEEYYSIVEGDSRSNSVTSIAGPSRSSYLRPQQAFFDVFNRDSSDRPGPSRRSSSTFSLEQFEMSEL